MLCFEESSNWFFFFVCFLFQLDARDPPSAQEDFEYVSSLLRKHGIRAQQLKFAWSKLCVCIFGTTSSGKSSLVNHLFTLVAASSSGAGQVDTGFSIFETVSDAEFRRMSPEAGPERDFSVQQLREPLKPADQNLRGDARYGHVFVYLTAEETLARYSQQLGDGRAKEEDVVLLTKSNQNPP
jgi:energy-coupling factor transporter ATP-binding protein EcfA2